MKPTIQFNEKSRRDSIDRASRQGSAQTDFSYQATSMGGRCFGSERPSFRSISQDYFNNEARPSFASEAALFTLILMTAAVPILHSVSAVFQLIRSFGAL
ncbi:MAG TPA: hypothetical protein VNP98_09735 [Chthoniobacterales bacterium]|nr:hypothetical protein [Chthoniobacterales bacterium]